MSKQNTKATNGYGRIEREVMCMPTLSIFAKAVYCLLISYAGSKDTCYPSLNTIVKNLGVSKPTVIKAINDLEKLNLIKVDRGINQVNVYSPLNISKGGGKPDLPPTTPEEVKPEEVVNPIDQVVKEVNHLVNDINHPSKTDLPGVVKEVYPKNNSFKNNKEEETIKNNNEVSSLAADAALQDKTEDIQPTKQELEQIILEEKKKKEKEKNSAKKEKAPEPCHTPCKDFYLQQYPEYHFEGKDAKHLNEIISKIRFKYRKRNDSEATEEQVNLGFQFLITHLPDWYKKNGSSLQVISSKFNDIYEQLKNGKSTNQTNATNRPSTEAVYDLIDQYYDKKQAG